MEFVEPKAYTSTVTIEVAWGEMDAFRHVNNAVYFRYFETARVKYFTEVGWDEGADDVLPILGTVAARYEDSVEYPDTLTVETGPVSLGDRKVVLAHRITNRAGKLVTLGLSVVVASGPGGAKAAVPEKASAAIREQLGGAPSAARPSEPGASATG